jgi:hypothetical protein
MFSGSLLGMFDFDNHDDHPDMRDAEDRRLLLDPGTGERIGW